MVRGLQQLVYGRQEVGLVALADGAAAEFVPVDAARRLFQHQLAVLAVPHEALSLAVRSKRTSQLP